jgi:fermentation-respiration switch protein FrsA (DUF1100 family)
MVALAFMLQLHFVHLMPAHQLQHAEAVTILWAKLGTVFLLQSAAATDFACMFTVWHLISSNATTERIMPKKDDQ